MRTIHAFISGRVQAVGFRYFTITKAQSIGINGWVKNTSDGRVEVVAQGEEQRINTFINQLKKGPSTSDVKDIHIEELDQSPEYRSFEITY